MNPLAHVQTARLQLDAITPDDLEPMFALQSDPRGWGHFPSGRYVDRDRTREMIANASRGWAETGLHYWAARLRVDVPAESGSTADVASTIEPALVAGEFVGAGGCMLRGGVVWNLCYRLRPEAWGHGFATEIARAAQAAAAQRDPDVPVIAYLVEQNEGSRRTAERAGLRLAARVPDAGNPDPTVMRLIYADRPLSAQALENLSNRP
ncbi:Protein N-acetyltransferase, RimJ/RimL family [Frankineae bacterium MT45]|nr:Protein N-acetyltransferase, RimJ/RimL family [Frankineae bacterium MT45]